MSAQSLPLDSPVLLARLRRAREDQGLSQGSVAEELGVARTTIVAIEQGERRLRPEELLALADIYGERLDGLLREDPPPRSLAAQFRTSFGRRPEQDELRLAAAELQRLSEDYVEVERLLELGAVTRYPTPVALAPGADIETEAALLAESERGRLGLGDGPLPHLRELLENDVGLRVFSIGLPSTIAGLFGFDPELGACVAINANQRWERQRWSMAHEYAHFLTRRDRAEVTVLMSSYRRVPASERFADAFARYFVLPASGVTRRYRAAVSDAGKATTGLLLQQADWWSVSFQAYVMRLEDLRLVKPGLHDRLARRGFQVGEGRDLLGLPVHPADARLLPRRFRLLAVTAYDQGLLSEERLAHLLREDRIGTRATVSELLTTLPEDSAQ
ncbi:MAG TPA: helix-turn-helix domain-containing protein [Solirubrobacteraceae bacterium]|jgi:Zn-dependent peptidase ImmA (M78 family)/DNA-binding XRE family transcriptional regulator|nr:helix-turn-helix domain-containing protein [Solirubrobacteraceae bacterium]